MNHEEKLRYMREYYRKNADRPKAYQRAKYSDRKADNQPELENACCERCKRFSAPEKKCSSGWCMKFRKVKRKKDICTEYIPNVKVRYEQPVHHIAIFTGE